MAQPLWITLSPPRGREIAIRDSLINLYQHLEALIISTFFQLSVLVQDRLSPVNVLHILKKVI